MAANKDHGSELTILASFSNSLMRTVGGLAEGTEEAAVRIDALEAQIRVLTYNIAGVEAPESAPPPRRASGILGHTRAAAAAEEAAAPVYSAAAAQEQGAVAPATTATGSSASSSTPPQPTAGAKPTGSLMKLKWRGAFRRIAMGNKMKGINLMEQKVDAKMSVASRLEALEGRVGDFAKDMAARLSEMQAAAAAAQASSSPSSPAEAAPAPSAAAPAPSVPAAAAPEPCLDDEEAAPAPPVSAPTPTPTPAPAPNKPTGPLAPTAEMAAAATATRAAEMSALREGIMTEFEARDVAIAGAVAAAQAAMDLAQANAVRLTGLESGLAVTNGRVDDLAARLAKTRAATMSDSGVAAASAARRWRRTCGAAEAVVLLEFELKHGLQQLADEADGTAAAADSDPPAVDDATEAKSGTANRFGLVRDGVGEEPAALGEPPRPPYLMSAAGDGAARLAVTPGLATRFEADGGMLPIAAAVVDDKLLPALAALSAHTGELAGPPHPAPPRPAPPTNPPYPKGPSRHGCPSSPEPRPPAATARPTLRARPRRLRRRRP